MKKNVLLVLMCMFAISTYAKKELSTVTFNVDMDCENCVKKIESNIAFEKGVKALDCNLAEKTVSVTYQESKTDIAKLKEGFSKIGYENVTEKKACCSGEKAEGCCSKDTKAEACSGKDCDKACCSKDAKKEACCSGDKAEACSSKDAEADACCSKGNIVAQQ